MASASTTRARGRRSARGRRRILLSILGGLLLGSLGIGCTLFNAPKYRGPAPSGARFDGDRFQNLEPFEPRSFGDVLRWKLAAEPGPWQGEADAQAGPPPPTRVGPGELRVTFVNHATTLVQLDGLNVLTDPVWSDRVGPLSFLGPKRMRPPGIRFEDLPPIDAVVISHNHYDHLDLPTLQRLAEVHRPRIFVGLGNAPTLRRASIGDVVELDWWRTIGLRGGVKITAVPAQHGSNRGLTDGNRTLWAGYVIEGEGGYAFFAGDTGFGPHFAQIAERFGPPRLAILPIGAYRPQWFMQPVHISPAEAVRVHRLMGAHRSVAMHFGTFRLADDGEEEPAEELAAARASQGVPADHFWVLGFGEGRDVPPLPTTIPQGQTSNEE